MALKWTNTDRFCMDGQRLVLESGANYGDVGSTYRTEIDSGVIATASGGTAGAPDYFEAQRKDGSTSYYGKSPNDADLSAKLTNGSGDVLTWSIRHFTDSVGNSIWFDYDTTSGAQRIKDIKYAYGSAAGPSGHGAHVEFTYVSRSDVITGYIGGHEFTNDQRLSVIKSYNNVSSEIRTYVLRYDGAPTTNDNLSRLTSLEECVGTTCLPRTNFTWRMPSVPGNFSQIASTSFGADYAGFTPADINGDGRMDLVWMIGGGASKTLKYAMSNGTSFTTGTFTNGNSSLTIGSSITSPEIRAIDYNMDGRQDIAWLDQSLGRWRISLSTPDGSGGWQLGSGQIVTSIPAAKATFADVDSNGTLDAVYAIPFLEEFGDSSILYLHRLEPVSPGQNPGSSTYYEYGDAIQIAGSGGEETIGQVASLAGDFDGDGQVDIVMGGEESWCDENNNCTLMKNRRALVFNGYAGEGTTPAISSYFQIPSEYITVNSQNILHRADTENMQVADVNGDGLGDMFYPLVSNSWSPPTEYRLRINKGNSGTDWIAIQDASMVTDDARPQLVDWNMDGHADIVWKDNTSTGRVLARYWNPQNSDFDNAIIVTWEITTSAIETATYLDFNGDAVPDIFKLNADGVAGSIEVITRALGGSNDPANVAVNRIETIVNGLGAVTHIDYEPLSVSDHYERLEMTSSPGTETVCKNLGHPNEEICWEEEVQVANTTDFYTKINGAWDLPANAQTLGKNSPIIEMSGPMYVVTDVAGDAPAAGAAPGTVNTNATSSISYHYSEAKIQAAGRGFLGFQRLTTKDNQSGVETTTRYRQDWPFIGSPIFTEVLSPSGHTLSQATTDWEIIEWLSTFPATAASTGTAALDSLHVVQTYSGEQRFDLVSDGATAGSLLSTVSIENTYDNEANATQIVVTTRSSNGTAVKIVDTDNIYLNNGTFGLFDGRLSQTTVTTTHNGTVVSPSRQSTFDYHPSGAQKGLLWHETIEPSTAYQLTTTHQYDSFGNRVYSSTSDGTETRCALNTATYDSRGRYVDSTYDCLGRKLADVTARNSFGAPANIKTYIDTNGIDYLTSVISYSVLGREYYRYKSDGSYATKYMTLSLSNCPSGTAFMTTSADGSGAASQDCIDVLGRSIRTMTKGFDGQWDARDTEFDNFGHVKRKSEPFDLISGGQTAPYWTTLFYDLLGRVTFTTLPDSSTGSTTYIGLTTVTTNDLGQTRTEVRNVLGEVVRVTDNLNGVTQFTYDHQGNMTTMADPANNATTIAYDLVGRKTQSNDPDKGQWTYAYNRFGELMLQTDAKGQAQAMTYDALGRIATRIDKTSGGTTEGSTIWSYDTAAFGLGQLASLQDTQSGYLRSVLYDSLGRADEIITNFDGGIYYEKTTFDQLGRIFQVFDAAGDGSYTDQGVVNTYNAYGYLESVGDAVQVNGVPRTVYRKVTAMNARGQVTTEERGIDNQVPTPQASVTTMLNYSSVTGRLLDIDGINAAGFDVQDLNYAWDTLGNLTSRQEMSGTKNLSESFLYDGLNRLTSQTVGGQSSVTLSYDGIGNITSKSDVGTYTYGAGSAGPHAVTGAGGATYLYDTNGSNKSGDDRTIQYTTFDKPGQITKGGHTTSFAYGPDRARYRRVDSGTGGTKTTRYIGNVEIIFQTNGDQDRKRYIAGVAIETIHFGDNSIEDYRETHYTHKDHLGSLDVITDSTGAIIQEQSFDAWGQRRNAINWAIFILTELTTFDHTLTTRGFTGHEMLDEVGVVHMNGRIYDAKLARFLQADPFIQDPMNTQSLNRYSYVINNPLNATDPTGFNFIKQFAGLIVGAILVVATGGAASPFLASWYGAAALGGIAGGVGAAVNGGNILQGIAIGAITGAATFGVAAGLDAAGLSAFSVEGVLSFGAVGGISSVLQGGKFGHGFVAAGVTAAVGGAKFLAGKGKELLRVITKTVVGGTVSKITGGKFANGAAYGAFASIVSEGVNAAASSWSAEDEAAARASASVYGDNSGGLLGKEI